MNIKLLLIFFLIVSNCIGQELRATWIARDYLTSKEALAQAMDSLAANNFNVVYVNAWSRGYPLWQSQVFYNETNTYIDPGFVGRDILAEAIAEGHKRGLHIEAWFEYGFVGGYANYLPGTSGKGKIFDIHPDWVAKKVDGSEKDDSNFYWMVQTRKDVQDFLIALVTEVCRKYDIDGIELDRIRYSSVQYGYDLYTDSLYKAEHGGTPPPINTTDQNWIRWRADKLNEFAARVYDSVKTINPKINLSNAPSLYSSSQYTSYYTYCQDWVWWVNNNKIDNVQVQSYVGSASTFSNILNYLKTLVNDINKVYPAFAVQPGTSPLPLSEILAMIDNTRSKGFRGNSIWYYTDLRSFLNPLKLNRYNENVSPPYSDLNWRKFTRIVSITDTLNAIRFGKWFTSLLQGFSSPSIYANGGDSASIDYYIDVPADGYYEIYPFIVTASDRSSSAEYIIIDSSGISGKVYVDQSNSNNKRWFKLGDFYLKAGKRKVVSISNSNVPTDKRVSADAVLIILNRRLSPNVITSIKESENLNKKLKLDFGLQNFPNPFNAYTSIEYTIPYKTQVKLKIFDTLGKELYSLVDEIKSAGKHSFFFDANKLSSGIYIYQLMAENFTNSKMMTLIK